MASVLTQAFDDCPTLRGRFRLLDCFSDLVHRPAIAEELQRKHSLMVQDFATEVALVMQVRAFQRRFCPSIRWLVVARKRMGWRGRCMGLV